MNPRDILDWKENEFFLWLAVSRESTSNELLISSLANSYAFWKPSELPKVLDQNDERTEEIDVSEVLERAEEARKMNFKETT